MIRIFNVSDGTKVYELRRGLKRTATIYSLSFSPCGHFLACSSNTKTIHIFRLDDPPKDKDSKTPAVSQTQGSSDSWMGYLGNVVSSVPNYLPAQVTDTLLQERAFATVYHKLFGKKNICALAMIKKMLRLLIVSEDGYLYVYSLDINVGGDCSLIRQFHLSNKEVQSHTSSSPDAVKIEQQILEATGQVDEGIVGGRPLSENSEKFHEVAPAIEYQVT